MAVSDAGDSTGAYSVRVATTEAQAPATVVPGAQNREWQPNVNGNQVAQDALTDAQPEHLWVIRPSGIGTLSIHVTATGYGTTLGLYDSMGHRVAQSVSAAGQQGSISYAVSMEDTYYIDVSSTSGVSTGSYSLSISARSSCPRPSSWIRPPGRGRTPRRRRCWHTRVSFCSRTILAT